MIKANLMKKQSQIAVDLTQESQNSALEVSKIELPLTAALTFIFLLIVSQPFFSA